MQEESVLFKLGFAESVQEAVSQGWHTESEWYKSGYTAGQKWLKRQSEAVEEATRNAYERGQAQAEQQSAETIASLRQLLGRTEQDWQYADQSAGQWQADAINLRQDLEQLQKDYEAAVEERQSAGEEIQELTRRLQEKQAQTAYERGWIAFESGIPCDASGEDTLQAKLSYDAGYEVASQTAFSVRKSDTVTRAEAVIGGIICGTALLLAVVGGILIGRIL